MLFQSSENKKLSPSTLGFSGRQPLGVHTSHAIDWPQWGISSGELSRPEEKGWPNYSGGPGSVNGGHLHSFSRAGGPARSAVPSLAQPHCLPREVCVDLEHWLPGLVRLALNGPYLT